MLLVAGRVDPAHRGLGIAAMLAQGVAKDLTRRGVRAVEAFAHDPRPGGDGADVADLLGAAKEPRHALAGPVGSGCLLPRSFLETVGFAVVAEHPRFPRMRLELRSALAWREDVEAALEQLLGSLTPSHA